MHGYICIEFMHVNKVSNVEGWALNFFINSHRLNGYKVSGQPAVSWYRCVETFLQLRIFSAPVPGYESEQAGKAVPAGAHL